MIWLCLPSARPVEEAIKCLKVWREAGYGLMIQRDQPDDFMTHFRNDPHVHVHVGPYEGYAKACNMLTRAAFELDPSCNWVVCAGDDTLPDPDHTPEEIARECGQYFASRANGIVKASTERLLDTFGVMQPTGDRFSGGSIDRICGSPWLGREFCRRMYGGAGPYWHEFTHMHVDEHLQCVAQKLGVLWQRPDLIHYHNHFLRTPGTDLAETHPIPPHLVEANSDAHWQRSKAILNRLRAGGFAEALDLLP